MNTHPNPQPKKMTIGPATWVAAAFIGPGTVTTCTLAGANFGFALLWALLFSVLACMVLQEMAARLGVVSGQGLTDNLREQLTQPAARYAAFALVALGILVGNAAYEGGNIAGATLGLDAIWPEQEWPWPLLIAALAAPIIALGRFKIITAVMMLLVLMMSLAFIGTFIMVGVDFNALVQGFVPTLPDGAILTVVALIGTTVVPYNLFLHATAAKQQWQGADNLDQAVSQSRKDVVISIGIGGLVSLAIVATAAAAFFQQAITVNNAADMAKQLTPLFGQQAQWLMGIGLFAAGLSSAITAPLAARYAISGMWQKAPKWFEETVPMVVLICGVGLAMSGHKPIQIIWFAQVANGLLLPLMAVFLLLLMNRTNLLGRFKNTSLHNFAGVLVVMITLLLSAKSLWSAFT